MKRQTNRYRFTIVIAAMAAMLLTGAYAQAQNTWDGGGADGNWTTGLNWVGDVAPANAVGGAIIFDGALQLVSIADTAAWTDISSLSFAAGANAFTVGGFSLTFQAGADITNSSANLQTINNDLVSAGAGLTIAADGANLAIGGAIDLTGGPLIVEGVNNSTLSGIISGAGALTKNEAGTLFLSGANTYTGITTINLGSVELTGGAAIADAGAVVLANAVAGLVLNNDETIGSLAGGGGAGGNINLNANTLTVGDATDTTYAGIISGGGALTKIGAGTLTLSGANTYTGITTINVGKIILTGSLSGNVSIGAMLQGTGTITGDVDNNAGGALAPGNSIGTLNIVGDYTQAAGSTLEIEISKSALNVLTNDLVAITGGATLEAGSAIDVTDLAGGGQLEDGDVFTIITTTTGVTDNTPTITFAGSSAMLSMTGAVNGNNYELTVGRASYGSAALNSNGRAVGVALDAEVAAGAAGDMATILNEIDGLATDAEVGAALNQLSGEPYSAVNTISYKNAQLHSANIANYLQHRRAGTMSLAQVGLSATNSETMLAAASVDDATMGHVVATAEAQTADSKPSSMNIFGQIYGAGSNYDTTRDRSGFRTTSFGGMFGVDCQSSDQLLVGASAGYTYTDINYKSSRGDGDIDTIRVGPYMTYDSGNDWFVDGSLTYGYHNNRVDRNVVFGGINRTAKSTYNAHDLSTYIGGGYEMECGDFNITPTASLQYIYYYRENFNEVGAGAANLVVDDQDANSLRSMIGVQASYDTNVLGCDVSPEIFVGWGHEFLADDNVNSALTGGVSKFSTTPGSVERDSVYFGVGASTNIKDNVSLFARYEGEVSDNAVIHAGSIGLTIGF